MLLYQNEASVGIVWNRCSRLSNTESMICLERVERRMSALQYVLLPSFQLEGLSLTAGIEASFPMLKACTCFVRRFKTASIASLRCAAAMSQWMTGCCLMSFSQFHRSITML